MNSANTTQKQRVLIFIVAYNAETTICDVLKRIPQSLTADYHIEVLIIDDASSDRTFEVSHKLVSMDKYPFKIQILFNPKNQGYGGNQKIGYHYAITHKFDFVALLHGDGQYAPECLNELIYPLSIYEADAVFGSRMLLKGEALKGGMPIYKYIGNKILTRFENYMLKSQLSEFHSGYRIYSVKALSHLPFDLNSNDFHFDTEIIIQLLHAGFRIKELPIPTYYGNEICRVNGIKYAANVIKAVITARAQSMGIFYARKFDSVGAGNTQYETKLGYQSPHSEVLCNIKPGSRVLDLGCAGGCVGSILKEKFGCRITGVDCYPLQDGVVLDTFIEHDLNSGIPKIDMNKFDYILLLDVIEHLSNPENFIQDLYKSLKYNPNIILFASSGNIAFFITRLMLLLGCFNYGKRGILDMTHTRLFTFKSFCRLFEQGGFTVNTVKGIPGPFPLALGENKLSSFLLQMNQLAIKISRGLFSYQVFLVAQPRPSLSYLLTQAAEQSDIRTYDLNSR